MSIEKQFILNSSSFTDPKWVPANNNNDDIFPTGLLESMSMQQQQQQPTIIPEKKKQDRRLNEVKSGRVKKRKSRVSKRDMTTFITTDVSNFRQMVQQMTGARVTNEETIVKHEPSFNAKPSLLLDGNCFGNGLVQQPETVVDHGGSVGCFGYDEFFSFPTLESWKA